jgi:glyoxylase-like metal-dependent hydrolase (beta-lactamase superfamily II)
MIQGLRIGHVYVIEGRDGLALVDTSLPGAEKQIAADLATRGMRLADVHHILITHAHPDHVGSLRALQEATGARVYMHPRDIPLARKEASFSLPINLRGVNRLVARFLLRVLPSFAPAGEVAAIAEGDTLDHIVPGLTVLETPGHTAGHIAFWLPSHKLLFCGDTPANFGGLRLPIVYFTPDMAEAARSIKKISALPAQGLAFGHGQPILRDGQARLQALSARLKV